MKNTTRSTLIFGLSVLALAGCGGGSTSSSVVSPEVVSPSKDGFSDPLALGGDGNLYASDRLVNVNITMDPAEFETLKGEGRTLASTAQACVPEYEYTEFTASVTIDGQHIPDVIIRKKGFLGSLSPSRPSLKLDFDDLVEDRTYQGMSRMTLNNNRQDPSNARQCLAYDKFRAVGIASPLCNLAHVTVNGEDLGIYTNVEPIKKPFLERTFGDKSGNLYEAQLSDFGQFLNDTFEKKTNKKEADRTDLQRVADALALPDDEMINVLPQVVDVNEFIRFWAMETLIGFWDSATGNANNFYIYRNPEDGLFHFIPWGADTAFSGQHVLKPETSALYHNFRLADRLWNIDSYRAQYLTTLQQFLMDQWNEDELNQEIARIQSLTGTTDESVSSLQAFIQAQRGTLEQAIASEDGGRAYLLKDEQKDCDAQLPTSTLTASVSAINGVDVGTFQFTLPDGQAVNASLPLAATQVDALVYQLTHFTEPGVVSLQLVGADINHGYTPYVLQVYLETLDYQPGDHSFHGLATNVVLFAVDESQPLGVRTLALGDTGTISLSNLGGDSGEGDLTMEISGTIAFIEEESFVEPDAQP